MTKPPVGPDHQPEADSPAQTRELASLLKARATRHAEQAAESKRTIKIAEQQDAVTRKMLQNAAKNREE